MHVKAGVVLRSPVVKIFDGVFRSLTLSALQFEGGIHVHVEAIGDADLCSNICTRGA